MLSTKSLVEKSYESDAPANILTIFYDGLFDSIIAQTGHNFYGHLYSSCYNWEYMKAFKPQNIHLLSKKELYQQHYDLILINNRFRNHESIEKFRNYFNIPVVTIDHENVSDPNYNKYISAKMVYNTLSISTSEETAKSHISDIVIEPEFKFNKVDKDIDIILVGDFDSGDQNKIERILNVSDNSVLISNLSTKYSREPKSYEEFQSLIARSKIYVHLSTKLNLCYSSINAVYNNCILISTRNPHLENYTTRCVENNKMFDCDICHSIEHMIETVQFRLNTYDKKVPNINGDCLGVYNRIFNAKKKEILIK